MSLSINRLYFLYRDKAWSRILTLAILCLVIINCAGFRIPRRGGEEEPPAVSRIVDEADLEGRQRSELAEEANEPDIDPLDPNDGLSIPEEGETVPLAAPPPMVQFRTGTYNALVMSAQKAKSPNTLRTLFGSEQTWEKVFDLMESPSIDIDILAVQEVYLSTLKFIRPVKRTIKERKSDHELLKRDGMIVRGKYKIISGKKVFDFTHNYNFRGTAEQREVTRTEFCPIIVNTEVLTCDEDGNKDIDARRKIHFVRCTVKDSEPELKFKFGCAHFAANQRQTGANIENTGRLLDKNGKVIIGGDFNSNVFGALKTKYEEIANLDRDPDTKAMGIFSKISKDENRIKIRKNPAFLILDDLIWTIGMRDFYVKNSKKIVDFGKKLPQDEPFFLQYFSDPDHLPVIADFMTMAGAQ
ncbi:hypothetical protein L0156_30375 [bacterium]|nr:hypothetical protein [bacterium]